MSRLIDADAFASELDFADADVCEEFPDGYCEFGLSREKIRELLRDIPTVDAVPVVRCRECKHMIPQSHTRYCTVWNAVNGMGDNGFCNYGERKEGAENEP